VGAGVVGATPDSSAALLGQSDSFPLAFPDERAFKFSECIYDGEHEIGHGGVLLGEDQALFDKLHPHAFACWALKRGHISHRRCEQAGPCCAQPRSVPLAGEPQVLGELRFGGVPAKGLVHKDSVQKIKRSGGRATFVAADVTQAQDDRCGRIRRGREAGVDRLEEALRRSACKRTIRHGEHCRLLVERGTHDAAVGLRAPSLYLPSTSTIASGPPVTMDRRAASSWNSVRGLCGLGRPPPGWSWPTPAAAATCRSSVPPVECT
jgi:hypothetical protein